MRFAATRSQRNLRGRGEIHLPCLYGDYQGQLWSSVHAGLVRSNAQCGYVHSFLEHDSKETASGGFLDRLWMPLGSTLCDFYRVGLGKCLHQSVNRAFRVKSLPFFNFYRDFYFSYCVY